MGREGINFQADPDTRSVTGEVPQLFCGILPARRNAAKAWPPLYAGACSRIIYKYSRPYIFIYSNSPLLLEQQDI